MLVTGPNPSTGVAAGPVCARFDSGSHMLAAQLKLPSLVGNYALVVDVYDTASPANLVTTAQQTITIKK